METEPVAPACRRPARQIRPVRACRAAARPCSCGGRGACWPRSRPSSGPLSPNSLSSSIARSTDWILPEGATSRPKLGFGRSVGGLSRFAPSGPSLHQAHCCVRSNTVSYCSYQSRVYCGGSLDVKVFGFNGVVQRDRWRQRVPVGCVVTTGGGGRRVLGRRLAVLPVGVSSSSLSSSSGDPAASHADTAGAANHQDTNEGQQPIVNDEVRRPLQSEVCARRPGRERGDEYPDDTGKSRQATAVPWYCPISRFYEPVALAVEVAGAYGGGCLLLRRYHSVRLAPPCRSPLAAPVRRTHGRVSSCCCR